MCSHIATQTEICKSRHILQKQCSHLIVCIIFTCIYCSSTSGYEWEFGRSSDASSQQLPYDIYSIMHYGSFCFSANGMPTLLHYSSPHSHNTAKLVKVTKTSVPTTYDYLHVNLLYCEGRNTVFHITD